MRKLFLTLGLGLCALLAGGAGLCSALFTPMMVQGLFSGRGGIGNDWPLIALWLGGFVLAALLIWAAVALGRVLRRTESATTP